MKSRSKGPRHGKRDANHKQICNSLRLYPWIVVFDSADVGGGFPDLVVGCTRSRKIALVELKMPGNEDDLTPAEKTFRKLFDPWYYVCTTADQVLDAVGYDDFAT